MFGRKLLASATSVVLLLTATAVQAAPPASSSLTTSWSSGAPGDLVFEVGQVTVAEAANGLVTLSFDITRTVGCLDPSGGPTIEHWQATSAPASLSIKNNLASATVVANITGGFSVTSNCGVAEVTGHIGPVAIDALATARTVRERTVDGVRILTRSVDVAINVGSLSRQAPGEIEKRIG